MCRANQVPQSIVRSADGIVSRADEFFDPISLLENMFVKTNHFTGRAKTAALSQRGGSVKPVCIYAQLATLNIEVMIYWPTIGSNGLGNSANDVEHMIPRTMATNAHRKVIPLRIELFLEQHVPRTFVRSLCYHDTHVNVRR